MASSGKPTAVHFTLIFFVMLSVILAVVAYLFYSENAKSFADNQKRKTELSALENQVRTQLKEINDLKTLVGYEGFEVGSPDDQDATTVLGAMQRDIQAFSAQNQGQLTYAATLRDLNDRLNSRARGEAEKQAIVQRKNQEYEQLRQNDQQVLSTQKQATQDADEMVRRLQQEKEEELSQKDQRIDALSNERNQLQDDLAQEKEDHRRDVTELQEKIVSLEKSNDRLNELLASATKQSFEVPDGVIRTVDQVSGMVWIGVGETDGVQPRTTFSVYTKDHQGVGRDSNDIKGAVEVTRVVGPHLSQARIVEQDDLRPIAAGDPVYSPLWSPGRVEQFSIVGLVDIDGDGISDRATLHDLIQAAGAKVDNEVDDEGNRKGAGIDVHTKFLVVGEIPEVTAETTEEERDIYARIRDEYKQLVDEARFQGVRRISLNDFLNYIGYKPHRRLFRPGENYRLSMTVYDQETQEASMALKFAKKMAVTNPQLALEFADLVVRLKPDSQLADEARELKRRIE